MRRLKNFVMLIPPLEEQERIVAKVDDLLALCDRLEAAQAEREAIRRRLLEAVLQNTLEPSGVSERSTVA